jgi:hypothetical protein
MLNIEMRNLHMVECQRLLAIDAEPNKIELDIKGAIIACLEVFGEAGQVAG